MYQDKVPDIIGGKEEGLISYLTLICTFLSLMKGMAKLRLFYSGAMALILPRQKHITHFVCYGCL